MGTNFYIPEDVKRKLALYEDAAKLSSALRAYVETEADGIDDASDEEIIAFADRVNETVLRLNKISEEIAALDAADNITPETEPSCERLRKTIRQDMEATNQSCSACMNSIQKRRDEYLREMLLARKKTNISAYMKSSFLGYEGYNYDERN